MKNKTKINFLSVVLVLLLLVIYGAYVKLDYEIELLQEKNKELAITLEDLEKKQYSSSEKLIQLTKNMDEGFIYTIKKLKNLESLKKEQKNQEYDTSIDTSNGELQ